MKKSKLSIGRRSKSYLKYDTHLTDKNISKTSKDMLYRTSHFTMLGASVKVPLDAFVVFNPIGQDYEN